MRIGGASPAAGAFTGTFIAGDDVGGHRAVTVALDGTVAHASASNLAHFDRVLGVTLGAASRGDPVTVRWLGEIDEPSWSGVMRAGSVWLGEDGALVQAPPSIGFVLQLGLFVPATRLIVRLGDAIQLTYPES